MYAFLIKILLYEKVRSIKENNFTLERKNRGCDINNTVMYKIAKMN